MRKLAIFAFSFSCAVFGANYLLPEGVLIPGGLALAVLSPLSWCVLRRRRRPRLAAALVCAGLSAGLLWMAAYSTVFFRPAQALDGRTVVITATVTDYPQQTDYGYSLPVRVDTDTFVKLSAVLYVDGQGAQLRPGDRISTVAHCTLGSRTLSGEEITYYTAKGIFLRGEAYGRLEVERPQWPAPRYWPALFAGQIKRGIQVAFPADAAPLIQALVTGNRDNLTDQFTTSLQRTGLSHVVVVSGMHLSLLAQFFSGALGKGKRSTAVATVVWVLLFCGVAGNTPSVTRAAVMIVLFQLAPLLGREQDGATTLGLALMLLLAWNPFSAAHVGLQLSFASVAGIFLVSDRIKRWLLHCLRLDRRVENKVLRMLRPILWPVVSVLSATLGAMVTTVPLVAYHFGYFSLIAPISNIMTLWAVGFLFLGGFFLGTLGMFLSFPTTVLAVPFTWLARYTTWVIEGLSRFSLASLPLDSFYYRAWVVLLYLLLGAAVLVKGKKRPILPVCAGVVTLCVCLLFTAMSFRAGVLTTAVLDVGQGQSALLRWDGWLALVDCGGDGQDNAGDVAADYLQSMGSPSLDLLVVSHYHADHANGIPQLLRRIRVERIALPDVEEDDPLRQEIVASAQAQGTEIWFIREDTDIRLGEDRELTLYPPLGVGTDTNELGLTVLATAGDFDVLLTGDMGGAVEPLLLAHADLPDIELLVAGHHGSKYSTTPALLEAVRPELAVISAGKNNSYGHPAQETLERLAGIGAEIYRTDLQGTVVIRANG